MPNVSAVQHLTSPARVFVSRAAYDVVRAESRRFTFRETGGVLFGYRVGTEVVVTAATGPGPRARHGARSFEPDSAYCQRLLGAVYRESGGAIAYQGDWHTHPHGAVEPSEL